MKPPIPSLDFPDQLKRTLTAEQYIAMKLKNFNLIDKMIEDLDDNPKNRYVYLLINGTIWKDLPIEWKNSVEHEHQIWGKFLESLIYVGKGTSDRLDAHVKEANKHQKDLTMCEWSEEANEKARRVLDFWRKQEGILSLADFNSFISGANVGEGAKMLCTVGYHLQIRTKEFKKVDLILEIGEENVIAKRIFEGISDAQALTREAAMIQALSLKHLKNTATGSMKIKSDKKDEWTPEKKESLGLELLREAFNNILGSGDVPYKKPSLAS